MHHLRRMLLLISLFAPLAGLAVTLGEARVNSFLNQPLDAEIDLIGLAPGQHEDLRLRVANQSHFERLGIAYDHFLASLQFDIVQSADRWLVRMRSDRPVAEPFIDFPLQMSWPGGQLIKQYTLLLDPPTRIQPARSASVRPAKAAAVPQATPITSGADVYGPVRSGETLWPIAQKLKPRGITTQQMAMALLRANPQAFIDNNVNKLRAGATLTVPPRGLIEELDAAAARAEFSAQSRRWQAPVATSPRAIETVAAAPAAPPAPVEPAQPPVQAPPQPRVEVESKPADAQLRILNEKEKTDAEPGSDQAIQEQLLVTMEEIESNRITTGAIESRLARLEAELDRMQRLVELKDAQIEALQSEVATRETLQQEAQVAEPTMPAAVPPQLPPALESRLEKTPAGSAQAPVPVVTIEPLAPAAAAPASQPVYEQYLWVVWVVLGLLGLSALMMLARRPQAVEAAPPMADLPRVNREAKAAYRAESVPAKADLKQAEADLRHLAQELADEPATDIDDDIEPVELPELDLDAMRRAVQAERPGGGLTNSLLDTMIDESKLLAESPEPMGLDTEFTDDDIASWVAELGAEAERADMRSANDEQMAADDDIPSILTELDDQLTSADSMDSSRDAGIELEPIDDTDSIEDDTFTMSLDLARAYLEIGDQDGAKDMLNQALSGARSPEHRRQIEELLQQID
ncbi:MAG: hypothetical protein KDI67_02990 [Gammaproteobacteria bacterium]|nr:hypothetical protein [Gammaproteobacteria bacterium]